MLRRIVALLLAAVALVLLEPPAAEARDRSLPRIDGNGDGVDSLAVVRRAENGDLLWYFADRAGAVPFGNVDLGDQPVPGDYDGDGRTDPAVVRPGSPLTWFVALSSGGYASFAYGENGDRPMPADYDGDGRTDAAVVRTTGSSGLMQRDTWFTRYSRGGFTSFEQNGVNGEIPYAADFDCDGRADRAFLSQLGNGDVQWSIYASPLRGITFGRFSDIFVPGDWDGDGCAYLMAVRAEGSRWTWYLLGSATGGRTTVFGNDTDVPFGSDADGTGSLDLGAWRMGAQGTAYYALSGGGFASSPPFGDPGDVLLASYSLVSFFG